MPFCGHQPLRGERHNVFGSTEAWLCDLGVVGVWRVSACCEGDRRFNIEQGINFQNNVSILVGHEDVVVNLSQLLIPWVESLSR